ncbi:MAG: ATP-binding protein [Alphaproteobacteria bacterium]|nr:ATP-binding protein [Alphaproteobacteria bacterium]
MNARSIYVRLIFSYTLLVACASIGFGAYTYYSLRGHLLAEMHSTLAHRVEHIRDDVLPDTANANPQTLSRRIEQIYSPEDSNRFIRITKKGGDVVYLSGMPQDHSFDPLAVRLPESYAGHDCSRMVASTTGGHLLIVGCNGSFQGVGYVIEMGAPTTEIDGVLHKFILTLLIGFPVVAFFAVIGGLFLARRALKPVEAIRATAEQITFSNLRQRLPVAATGDAIEHLSRTLNRMLDRLDQAYQQASRFSADASHELRTPLAIMRSELESMVNGHGLPAAAHDRLGSILEEIERLSGIVESLFAIARLDAGEAKTKHDKIDLSALARSTLEQMQLLADEKRLSVRVDAQRAVYVMGDAARLKQVVVNLLDNAFKYTTEGGVIELSVLEKPPKALLVVRDNGVGIPHDALPHIFERFYRADKVRSRTPRGAGLGLSIVRAICQAHGGTIEAQSEEGRGTTMTVELPLVSSVGE